jgi:F0F1-type ATP synthase membrane subunit c/vacuolar-type H+-ATPase subunit K
MGVSNSPTLQDWQTAYANGHDIGFDGSSDDSSLVDGHRWATVADALANMKSNSQYLIENGMPRAARHGCWPFGSYESSTRFTRVATTAAASTNLVLTTGNTTGLTAGMAVFGTAFASGTTIAAVVDSANVTPSQAPKTAGAGYAVMFVDTTQPFFNSKLLDAVKADGQILTMRGVGAGDVQNYSRFGLGDRKLMYPAYSLSNSTTAAAFLAEVDKAILRGTTLVTFGHNVIAAGASPANGNEIDAGVLGAILDGLVQRQQAGQLDILTVSQWYARDIATPAIPPIGYGLDLPKRPANDNSDQKAAA